METPDFQHSIKVAAKRTGLSPHVIRAWERRYATVRPGRTGGNRRQYTQADIERLTLLRMATEAGHPIGDVAGLATDRLRELVAMERGGVGAVTAAGSPERDSGEGRGEPVGSLIERAMSAVEAMDSPGLEAVLERALVEGGQVRMLNDLIAPLVERIGEAWREGRLKVAHEHVATAALRTFLGNVSRPIAIHPGAPVLLVTTPAGQLHELGAALVAAAATGYGWRVTYAGPAMPAEEIVSAVKASAARAVALSIVHPADDPALDGELRRLRRLLPSRVAILAGGRVAGAYSGTLGAIGAVHVRSLADLTASLDRLAGAPA